MTRKRFIKLCMSLGYQRNIANGLAELCVRQNSSYQEYFETVKRSKAIENAGVSLQSVIASFRDMCVIIVETLIPVFKRFADCMKEVDAE